MNLRTFLPGVATGFVAGYAVYRALEAFTPVRPVLDRSARRYGALRRGLMLSGIARSLSGTATVAYGPVGRSLEDLTNPLPVWLQPSALAVICGLLDVVVDAGTNYVEDFALERRFELSDQSLQSWALDRVKEEAIGLGVVAILTGVFAAVVRRYPTKWPIIATTGTLPLLVFANIAIPLYVMPLFNKYTPIEGESELRLRALADRHGVGDAEILRMDMSKQTKKANAFVTGIGGTHRIVVGDTLIENFTMDEIEFVVAHELGHYVARDSWRMIAAGELVSTIVMFGSYALLRDHSKKRAQNARTLLQIAWWSSLLTQAMRPALSAFSRSREWAADRFAVRTTAAPHAGVAAFTRLREQNLAEDEQPAWYEFLFASHPSLRARIAALAASP